MAIFDVQQITEERYEKMLGAVPPLWHCSKGFLLGEAADSAPDGQPTFRFYTFWHFHDGWRYFEGVKPITLGEWRALDIANGVRVIGARQ